MYINYISSHIGSRPPLGLGGELGARGAKGSAPCFRLASADVRPPAPVKDLPHLLVQPVARKPPPEKKLELGKITKAGKGAASKAPPKRKERPPTPPPAKKPKPHRKVTMPTTTYPGQGIAQDVMFLYDVRNLSPDGTTKAASGDRVREV